MLQFTQNRQIEKPCQFWLSLGEVEIVSPLRHRAEGFFERLVGKLDPRQGGCKHAGGELLARQFEQRFIELRKSGGWIAVQLRGPFLMDAQDLFNNIGMFRKNTAAFVHELPFGAVSNVDGEGNYVRVQVLTPVGDLDRDKQLGVVQELTEIVASAAGDPGLRDRTWVLLTESPEGGWGIAGQANTNADIAAAARAALAAK